MDAVLVIDKPRGMTSHDVVARVRKLLGQKSVGHAGTLDPLATGVLVVLAGQATKLASFLTAADKLYSTTIALGVTTDSLDADGAETARAPVSPSLAEELARGGGPRLDAALAAERARTSQIPPAVSALHVDGVRAHALARKVGAENVELAPRDVSVIELAIERTIVDPSSAEVRLRVSKGYYVRAFARDFASALGTVGHVSRLRRLASGSFTIEEATALERDALAPLSIADAARRALPIVTLTEEGALRASQGKSLSPENFQGNPGATEPRAWLRGDGALIAIGQMTDDGFRVLRGFTPE